MNKTETEKFNQAISEGFYELIKNRPEKPLDHFVYFLLSSLPEETRRKDKNLLAFYNRYEETLNQPSSNLPDQRPEPSEKSLEGSIPDKEIANRFGDFE